MNVEGYGTFTIRIANKSTPEECTMEGFSQTACCFVIEFVDVITVYPMNLINTNKGGWQESKLRIFINNDIYSALPKELKSVISDTYVVFGYGASDSGNFITTDKLYLLSTKEVWESESKINYDTATTETRPLDYYNSVGVNSNNYGGAIKFDSSRNSIFWWLRTAQSSNNNRFFSVSSFGDTNPDYATFYYNVTTAFRLS